MAYTKLTDFATKDTLLSGNPAKLVRGSEIDAEFNAIATDSSTKDTALANVVSGVTPVATATNATNATTATKSTNLAGGGAGQIPYQSAADTTAMLAAGSSGQILQSNGAAPPSWVAAPIVTQIQPISASVSSNALTISASALSLDFRSTTQGSGAVTRVIGTPASLVVPSTATLGTTNAIQSDLYVIALNNAGTIELAVVNSAGGNQLDETNLLTTTAISAAATSASTIYSTTARTNLAYRVIGVIRSTQATAGTWATAPSLIQGAGGNALDAMQSLGYGQIWQSFSRTSGTTYYNTTGKPIEVWTTNNSASVTTWTTVVGGVTLPTVQSPANASNGPNFVVPPGTSYNITWSIGGTLTVLELR